jgi:hypothetical protein
VQPYDVPERTKTRLLDLRRASFGMQLTAAPNAFSDSRERGVTGALQQQG